MISVTAFHKKIYTHFEKEKRSLPWRQTRDPYKILVSEVMLQQTQAVRVVAKYKEFVKKFPTPHALAKAETKDVLVYWQGLGYNRRALSLKRAAEAIVKGEGEFPKTYESLLSLPGVGPYTANAIMAFAYNKPCAMIETNIRAVFIHFFFADAKKVSDRELLPLIEKYLDHDQPRQWYNALMDYGAMLKRTRINPSRTSAHHTIQSKFQGSNRQVRGAIIKLYTENPKRTLRTIIKLLPYTREVIEGQYKKLKQEGFF